MNLSGIPILGLLGTDDESFAIGSMAGYDLEAAAELVDQPVAGISPAVALAAAKAEQSLTLGVGTPATHFYDDGYVTRAPFRLFSDFVGADPRFRDKPNEVTVKMDVDAKSAGATIRSIVEGLKKETLTKAVTGYPDGNPKTAMGMKKPDLSVVPASSLLHLATAMMNGSVKYGPYNYRDQPVSARTYIAAALRHLLSYQDGEDFSSDTVEAGAPVHHLAHVMACCAILLDTTEVGTLNDNRPSVAGKAGEMVDRFNDTGTLRLA